MYYLQRHFRGKIPCCEQFCTWQGEHNLPWELGTGFGKNLRKILQESLEYPRDPGEGPSQCKVKGKIEKWRLDLDIPIFI